MSSEPDSRCTGHCCRRFTLSVEPQYLWRLIYSVRSARDDDDMIRDNVEIARMVIPLEDKQPIACPPTDLMDQHHYTCRHFDGRDCTIYEQRPYMCREHPVDNTNHGKCTYQGCTFRERPPDFVPASVVARRFRLVRKAELLSEKHMPVSATDQT